MHNVISAVCASFDGDSPIRYAVLGDEVEFELGSREQTLGLLVTEEGLARIVAESTRALNEVRSRQQELCEA